MEFVGLAAFALAMINIGLSEKVKILKKDVRKIKNSIKGEVKMSEILKELEGKRCLLTVHGSSPIPIDCQVISVDSEWIKISQMVKKNEIKIRIVRVENIQEVSIV